MTSAHSAAAGPSVATVSAPLEVRIHEGRLFVNGGRRILVGGEIHNSGASTPEQIRHSFESATSLGLEVVLAPITWEQIEPFEGSYDFELVDVLVGEARARRLLLIPLWFGTWKNGMSTYVPAWVKTDRARFPRIELPDGERIEAVTPFSEACRTADAQALARLLQHLRATGADVVPLVQIENEVGTLGAPRDMSPLAEAHWSQPVPEAVVTAVASPGAGRLHGAWSGLGSLRGAAWADTFGDAAPEAFMAWAYARYVETVAAAGRAHLNVPMFVNAWLDVRPDSADREAPALTGGVQAGEYPSGGPLRHTAAIWKSIAPTIDFLAPDIYAGPFDVLCAEYRAASGVLLIPEMRCDAIGVAQMFRAIGEFSAVGVSPFGIDTVAGDDPDRARLTDGYRLLRAAARTIEERPNAAVRGFLLTETEPRVTLELESLNAEIVGDHQAAVFPPQLPGYGILIVEGDQLIVIGRGFGIRLLDRDGRRRGFLRVEELDGAVDGRVVRRLNGDEAGEWLRMPALGQTQSSSLPIRQNLRLSGIVRVETYEL